MSYNVYFDVLDTAQTALGGGKDQDQLASECMRLGEAEIKMSILSGSTPVFSQSGVWDSTALLTYASGEDFQGLSFLWLLKKGLIRVPLWRAPSIWDAAIAAFENPAYDRFGAWPEFNTTGICDARKALVEAMKTGKRPRGLPTDLWSRAEVLRQLSEAIKEGPPVSRALDRGNRLARGIKQAAESAEKLAPDLAHFLYRCVAKAEDPNMRSAIYRVFDGEGEQDAEVVWQARQITNGCYNAAVAECVDAHPILTFPLAGEVPLRVLQGALPSLIRSDLREGVIERIQPGDAPDLEPVTWEKLREFLQECSSLNAGERTREAEAAKLIANIATKERPRYALIARGAGLLFGSAVWGAANFMVASLAGAIPAIVAGSLAGGVGGLNVSSAVERRIAGHLKRKWLGLIQARRPVV